MAGPVSTTTGSAPVMTIEFTTAALGSTPSMAIRRVRCVSGVMCSVSQARIGMSTVSPSWNVVRCTTSFSRAPLEERWRTAGVSGSNLLQKSPVEVHFCNKFGSGGGLPSPAVRFRLAVLSLVVVLVAAGAAYGAAGDLTTTGGFSRPVAVAAGPDGAVYVAEADAGRVVRLADGRQLVSGLQSPQGLAVAPDGTVYVSDTGGGRVVRFRPDSATTAVDLGQFNRPGGLAVAADGTVYVAETGANRVRAVTPDGTVTTVAGTGESGFSGDGGRAAAAGLSSPLAV